MKGKKISAAAAVIVFTLVLLVPLSAKEFIYSVSSSRLNLNPLESFTSTEAQVYTAIFEGLVTYHPFTLQPLPGMAERWDVTPDGIMYTFYIRDNARYWNGEEVTADHFRQTWLALIDPGRSAEYASLLDIVKGAREYRTGSNTDPDSVGITVIDRNMLEIELVQPASHFLQVLCHHSFAPLHPAFLEIDDWTGLESVMSNGAFMVMEATDEFLRLKKNNLYWDARNVKISEITILYQDDPDENTSLFNRGEIHWIDGNVRADMLLNPESIIMNPIFATNYYFFSVKEAPFDDSRIRRGLALLLPWNQIRSDQILFLPTHRLVPQLPGYPDITGIQEENHEEAMDLLSEAGFPGGRGLPKITILIPEGSETRRVASLMKNRWETELALEVEIRGTSFQTYYDELKKPGYTLGTISWIGDFADPLTFLKMWTSDSTLNLAGFSDSRYDDLVNRSIGEVGRNRFSLMGDAESILLDGALVMPVRHSPAFNIIDLELIEGWYPNPLDIHPFKYLRFSEPSVPDGTVFHELPDKPAKNGAGKHYLEMNYRGRRP